jgi:hypothetical protein
MWHVSKIQILAIKIRLFTREFSLSYTDHKIIVFYET